MVILIILAILLVILVVVLTRKKTEKFVFPLTYAGNNYFNLSRKFDFVESISGLPPSSQVEVSFQDQDNIIKVVLPTDSNGMMKWNRFGTGLPMLGIVYAQSLIKAKKSENLQASGFNVPEEVRKCASLESIKFPFDTVNGRIYLTINNGTISN
jgi:hypothetical protein